MRFLSVDFFKDTRLLEDERIGIINFWDNYNRLDTSPERPFIKTLQWIPGKGFYKSSDIVIQRRKAEKMFCKENYGLRLVVEDLLFGFKLNQKFKKIPKIFEYYVDSATDDEDSMVNAVHEINTLMFGNSLFYISIRIGDNEIRQVETFPSAKQANDVRKEWQSRLDNNKENDKVEVYQAVNNPLVLISHLELDKEKPLPYRIPEDEDE